MVDFFFGGPSYGEDPRFWISGGRAGMVDFLRRFLVWADDFGVPARDPSSAFVLGGGGAGMVDLLRRLLVWADEFGI